MTFRKMSKYRNRKQGLILLIVLGMLAMFSLLAVTYVVTAGASRAGSKALEVRARNSGLTIAGTARRVMDDALRGTNNQKSPFFTNSLLGDVFGPNPIRTLFGPTTDVRHYYAAGTGVNLVKVPVDRSALLNGPLSGLENEYNSRLLTVQEGPLSGETFRILKYVGYVGVNDINTNTIVAMPWSDPTYTGSAANPLYVASVQYSVLIDLNEVVGREFTGEYLDVDGTVKTVSYSLADWIGRRGISSLFFFNSATPRGYKLLINDAPFNSAGIGLEDVAALPPIAAGPPIPVPGYGNIDSRRLLRTTRTISPALLTHYDYLQDGSLMATNPYSGTVGVDGIGTRRSQITQNVLNGSSNEGFDVPDYRDAWLAHQTYISATNRIITPSYHRPEVINYISNLFGNPSSMSAADVEEMLRLIDASTSRMLSYSINGLTRNIGFRENDPTVVRLPAGFTWTPANVPILQAFVRNQIIGSWDVDNDGDGVADSVWMDPGLATVFAPDGRRLRPLVAMLIEDMDGRINLNTAGDRVQGAFGFSRPAAYPSGLGFDFETNGFYKRPNQQLPMGFGYGPAEISLSSLLKLNTRLLTSDANDFSFFDHLTGARKYTRRPIVFANVADRVPGQARPAAARSLSELGEREIHNAFSHNRLPGLPLGRRGAHGMSYDPNGNPALISSVVFDGNPYAPNPAASPSETHNDKYESTAMENPIADDPLGLRELESILRRYDEDAASLSDRLRTKLGLLNVNGYSVTDPINREITVRSGELRYPNLAAALKEWDASVSTNVISAQAPSTTIPSYLRYIQMLHSQRHRIRSFPPAVGSDDPEINYAALAELFPMDFAKGLRMDLNRPFGNGFDDNNDGEVDEPSEIFSATEQERFPIGTGSEIRADGAYARDVKTHLSHVTRGRLGSRQVLARNLYCLGQLIIPRDYQFPGMSIAPSLANARMRATAIAQWAVNVVDFRDADAAMTRFEFDILPFGCGTNGGTTARPAYWAPDRIDQSVNGVSNKTYVGVVWGMEMPELLLSETLSFHDRKARDTDLDLSGKTTTAATSPDMDFDQYRFPQASLFLEVYNPRTTDATNNNLIPGAPSSLYTTSGAQVELDLGRVPTFGTTHPTFGAQPVWRIAISEAYDENDTKHPNYLLKNNDTSLPNLTHQWSFDATARNGTGAFTGTVEEYAGNNLDYNLANKAEVLSKGFERFVWFSNTPPAANSTIPDSIASLAGYGRQCVYVNQSSGTTLAGGSYLVVGPRGQTNIGSLTHNQFTGVSYVTPSAQLERMTITPANRPVLSPSFQTIDISSGGAVTYLLNAAIANQPWTSGPLRRIKAPRSIVCSVPAPNESTALPNENWDKPFPYGIGLNVSFPRPVAGESIWQKANIPFVRLNMADVVGTRSDGSAGFGDLTISGFPNPPDSWVDTNLTPIPATQTFPNTPIDKMNPILMGARYRTKTYEDFRVAYLQRLADPDFHYHPVNNPYITVDWMSIDLTVFNGEAPLGAELTDDPAPYTAVKFQSRYKNGALSPLAANHAVTLNHGVSYYSPMNSALRASEVQMGLPATVTSGTGPTSITADPAAYFMYQLGYEQQAYSGNIGNSATTFGYCNAGYYTAGLPNLAQMNGATSADFDAFGPPIDSTLTAYKGAPGRLAGLTWFNRPFASPYEMMMVPLTSPGLFGLHHSAFTTAHNRDMLSYVPSYQTANAWNVNVTPSVNPPGYWAVPDGTGGAQRLADWPLLLEFVETQPPFADATRSYNPFTILGLANPNYPADPLSLPDRVASRFLNSYLMANYTGRGEPWTVRGPSLLGPFNTKPSFVATGKINLNTISFGSDVHSRALKALEHNYLVGNDRNAKEFSDLEAGFLQSRQGFDNASVPSNLFLGAPVPGMHPDYPTRFVGAFRPAISANLAPVLDKTAATEKMRSRYGVESTLLRSNDLTLNSKTMSALETDAMNRTLLLQANQVADELETTQPFVRMQRAMRLPNLVTNQSNVFAVWVTVSLYEYDPITGFGNEYIGENGLPERERQFFMIDRTIPVGYKPGENLNTERTILLQRRLP